MHNQKTFFICTVRKPVLPLHLIHVVNTVHIISFSTRTFCCLISRVVLPTFKIIVDSRPNSIDAYYKKKKDSIYTIDAINIWSQFQWMHFYFIILLNVLFSQINMKIENILYKWFYLNPQSYRYTCLFLLSMNLFWQYCLILWLFSFSSFLGL